MAINIGKLLAATSADSPCGEDLEFDPAFLELERIAQGTPEQQVGDTIVEAVEPDWREVRNQAAELMERTKDLRVIVHFIHALIASDGIPGLRDGMAVLAGVLEKYWAEVYPRLDPDDNNDPMMRMNILRAFAPPGQWQGTPTAFRLLLAAPLVVSPVFHRAYALRDIRIAKGEMEAPPPKPDASGNTPPAVVPDDGALTAALTGDKLPQAQAAEVVEGSKAVAAAAAEAADLVSKIDSMLDGYVGAGNAVDFSTFGEMVKSIQTRINEYLAAGGVAGIAPAAAEAGAATGGAPAAGGAGGQGPAISGSIQSPDDVIRTLDKICDYYEQYEPSSPVPLLLIRARKLVRKSFMEIIQDLSPEAVHQIEVISGPAKPPTA
jgi:type VI secretion system protein ImpA